MLREEAAKYVGITVKQLDGYSNRYTLMSVNRWNGYSYTSYFRLKDLDLLKIRIEQRRAKSASRSISIVEDTLRPAKAALRYRIFKKWSNDTAIKVDSNHKRVWQSLPNPFSKANGRR